MAKNTGKDILLIAKRKWKKTVWIASTLKTPNKNLKTKSSFSLTMGQTSVRLPTIEENSTPQGKLEAESSTLIGS